MLKRGRNNVGPVHNSEHHSYNLHAIHTLYQRRIQQAGIFDDDCADFIHNLCNNSNSALRKNVNSNFFY